MGNALPPPELAAEHAYVVEYRPLDRCFVPACSIRTRNVAGYANDTQADGDPGAYVSQGSGTDHELYFQRGVQLGPGEAYEFDLPPATHSSELDVMLAATTGDTTFAASIVVKELRAAQEPAELEAKRVDGRSGTFGTPSFGKERRFSHYGTHVRQALPSRKDRSLRVSIVNRGTRALSVGSPLVMRRVEGRGPRQAFLVVHDAVPFYMQRAYLFGGTHDPKSDWVRRAVSERGLYFPEAQSVGQGTAEFVVRFFRGSYFDARGWPAMYGKGFDERLPDVLPGPVARMAEQGFVTTFVGNNFALTPNTAHVGWDVAYQLESKRHPVMMAMAVEDWAEMHPADDSLVVWWSSATHGPFAEGRATTPAPKPVELDDKQLNHTNLEKVWRNLMASTDQLATAYEALRKAAPHATRVVWLGTDHSTGTTQKMKHRAYRTPTSIASGLAHTCGGTSEEAEAPFALLFDEPTGKPALAPRVVHGRLSNMLVWRAVEARLGVDVGLPRTSTFRTDVFGVPRPSVPDWDDRIVVSAGYTGTMRAVQGPLGYALYEGRLSLLPVWKLPPPEQLVLLGAPTRSRGMMDEELYDDAADPFELENVAGDRFETTLALRRELVDWMAAHYEDHQHPRHRYRLVFDSTVDVDLFAPHPFTALVDDVPVKSADRQSAHIHAKEVVIVEGADAAGILEIRGAAGPLTLVCSANGLPLDIVQPGRARFNLTLARTNCPLPSTPHDRGGAGRVLFSFEKSTGGIVIDPTAPGAPLPNARGGGQNEELLAGMKRWGYVRDLGQKKE